MQKLRMHDKLPLRRRAALRQNEERVLHSGMHRLSFLRFCRRMRGRKVHLHRERVQEADLPGELALRMAAESEHLPEQQVQRRAVHLEQPGF